jgi:hypothetical protein
MAKRGGRRSGYTSRPQTHQTHASRWNRVTKAITDLGTVTKIVISIGALAGAITAVLTLILPLLPKSSPENVARFVSVRTLTQVTLSEFPQRSAVFGLQSADQRQKQDPVLTAAVVGQSSPPSGQGDAGTTPSPTPSVATPSPTPSVATPSPSPSVTTPTSAGTTLPPCATSSTEGSSPNCTAPPTGTASPSASNSPTETASPTDSIKSLPPVGMSPLEAVAYANRVAGLVAGLAPKLVLPPFNCTGPKCPVIRLLHIGCTTPLGRVVKVPACAHTIAGILNDSASEPAGSDSQSNAGSAKKQPLGELVSVDLQLTGLQGQPVFLSWSIFQERGPSHLSGKWLKNFVAYRLEATTDNDTGTLEMWIPLPKQHGPYFVRLTLTTAGASLASMDSGPFG